ncbi:acyltransferase ChoActase/COT/CPT [Gonapodya prolifera JEL478]|uniref:Acyltransferase ChoActase/COT/CPT n=1 Tax=Gonapodya prolifera (strain JEL478) TaxID=1344416 RepID=A0A139AI36_GONPJ|nr:acyltransferase ChoActase/COT/CPT [Gonapodya prolifera JEL478]|eukprot:KXS16095.1 acyltransferase ChoActase/COT/CPT [Gonapodya prolifera JEL478]
MPGSESPLSRPTNAQLHRKTFSNQKRLPRLPIPSLKRTCELYLESLKPLASEQEYQESERRVQEFLGPDGMGMVLQQRLMEWDKTQKVNFSWLEEIWTDKAYLEWRDPSLINTNWWAMFKNHPKHPKALLQKPPPRGSGLSSFQVQRAAGLVNGFLEYMSRVARAKVSPEFAGSNPQCMSQLKRIFSSSRIADLPRDYISSTFPPRARHIIVAVRDQLYRVEVLAAGRSIVPLAEIERLLYAVGRDALSAEAQPAVGIMTSDKRDTWATVRRHIESLSIANKQNLSVIDDALFVLCLDDYSSPTDQLHKQLFHGDASNRWFDKTIQLVVANDGRAGINAEHSAVDAMVVVKVFEHALAKEPVFDTSEAETANLPNPSKLLWDIDESVMKAIDAASTNAEQLISNTETLTMKFPVYGKEYISKVGDSTDAYVQMALQLTWARLYDVPTATYETASTRSFLHGRTETVRVCTEEAVSFARSFDDDEVLYKDKVARFRAAIKKQNSLAVAASRGEGIDRHLLGLRCMIQSEEERRQCEIFTDPVFGRSMWFRLSTSNIGPGVDSWGGHGGFGPVVNDGYGISYSIGKESIAFNISARKKGGKVDVQKFLQMLDRSLKDMMVLFPKRSEVLGKSG